MPIGRLFQSINRQSEFSSHSHDFPVTVMIFQSQFAILDRVESLESRIVALETSCVQPVQTSYSDMVSSNNSSNAPSSISRIDKLEYTSSEEERENRILQIAITHPDIDQTRPDLLSHTKHFLEHKLGMPPREIDSNLNVQKTPRPNTVLLKFSDKRFKIFLFSARKKLRISQADLSGLYIIEHLTSYNYSLLKALKSEKKHRYENNLPNFNSVYSFEGKVYVKLPGDESPNLALHIKNPASMNEFLRKLVADFRS